MNLFICCMYLNHVHYLCSDGRAMKDKWERGLISFLTQNGSFTHGQVCCGEAPISFVCIFNLFKYTLCLRRDYLRTMSFIPQRLISSLNLWVYTFVKGRHKKSKKCLMKNCKGLFLQAYTKFIQCKRGIKRNVVITLMCWLLFLFCFHNQVHDKMPPTLVCAWIAHSPDIWIIIMWMQKIHVTYHTHNRVGGSSICVHLSLLVCIL